MRDFTVVTDGDSVPMITSADGRLLRLQEFIDGQWVHPNDVGPLTEAIVVALNDFCERHAK